MANNINNRRYNKLLSYRNHYYGFGDFLNKLVNNIQGNPDKNGNITSGLFKGMSGASANLLGSATTAIGGIAGNALSGGLESGIGNAIGGLSNIASAIPGPWGAVAGAGLQVVGGLANRTFGSKLNQENINAVNKTIDRLNNFKSDASNFDTLADTWGSTALGSNFSNSFIGKDGWASNKAKRKAKQLREKLKLANAFVENSLQNNADNIAETTMDNLEANYAALGGFLNQYADGGSIYINPENRDKFNATKERTGKTIEELTHSKNPLTRKRAIFAQNAAKWHHAFGGELNTNGGDFSTGLTFIDEGGTHESNPYEGVPMGIAPDGKPNLVEEGEVIYNDYVFSNRLTVPKNIRSKYKLRGTKDLTFADAVKQISKNTTERPNDPISQETLHEIMSDLAQIQEEVRETQNTDNQYSHGGVLGTLYEGFGDGLQLLNKTPGLSLNYNDYIKNSASDIGKSIINKGVPTTDGIPRDMFGNIIFNNNLRGLNLGNYYVNDPSPSTSSDDSDKQEIKRSYEGYRFAPAIGLGMTTLSDALGFTNKPDYSEASMIEAATRGGSYMPVSWNPIGNKLTYRPFDRDYYTNKLSAEAGATRRALANQSGGNSGRAMAGILAADYNAQGRLGDLFRKSEEYNLEQRQKVEDFNRAINQANSQGMLQADMANQQAYANARDYALKGTMAAAEMRQRARMAAEAAKSANFSGFLSALGDIGYENKGMNMIRSLYASGALGPMHREIAEGFDLIKSKPKNKKSRSLTKRSSIR